MNVIIAPSYIELGEMRKLLKIINEVGGKGKWIGIFDGVFIEVRIVLNRAKFSVLLLYEEKGDA